MGNKLSFKTWLSLELFRLYRNNTKKIHTPDYIFWECTLRCTLKCLHCGSDCKVNANIPDMPVADFIKAIDDIIPIVDPNKTMVVFTGGEPLVRNDIEECGLELYKRGFPWGLVSNGYRFDEQRLIKMYQAGLRSVTISLDGLEGSHNWLRGNEQSYSRAVKTIAMLAGFPDIRFDVVSCITAKSFPERNLIKELLIGLGVKEWRIFTIFPVGRARGVEELQLGANDFRLLFDFIESVRNEGRIKLNYGCEGFLGNYEGKVRDNLFFCRAGISVASILADGSIAACPNIRNNPVQGNIYRHSFREVWENKYQSMRNRTWMKNGICNSCRYFKYCDGNGLHLRDEKGNLLFCHLERMGLINH